MFFQYRNRIKTQPRIGGQDDDLVESKNRLKIKNIRFSLDQQFNKMLNKMNSLNQSQDSLVGIEKQFPNKNKKVNYFNKLPELHLEKEQQKDIQKETFKLKYPKCIKKETFLNSIMEKIKPNKTQTQIKKQQYALQPPKMWKQWKIQTNSKQFVNQFFQENMRSNNFKSAKHYRAPKILQNQMIKFKNNNNVIRRKIFSEDKQRQRIQKEVTQTLKHDGDLDKIEIITFSNKFPGLRKQ